MGFIDNGRTQRTLTAVKCVRSTVSTIVITQKILYKKKIEIKKLTQKLLKSNLAN